MSQVQLLVSEQDVENYKQIKADLDQLRLTVEKSELWVEKSVVYTGEELAAKMAKEPNAEVLCSYLKVKHLKATFYISELDMTFSALSEITVCVKWAISNSAAL